MISEQLQSYRQQLESKFAEVCDETNSRLRQFQDDLIQVINNVLESAYDIGRADAQAQAQADFQSRLDQAIKEEFEKGKAAGYQEALETINQTAPAETEEEPAPEQVPVYSIENEAIAAFMADPTYYQPGFATGNGLTVVDEYIKGAKEGSKQSWTEQPATVPIEFDSLRDEDGNDVPVIEGICNLIPGRIYSFSQGTMNGKFKATGTVRMIRMADADPVVNIRDLGGYPCQGGHVAYGKVLRSATLNRLTKTSTNTAILKALGVIDEISFSSSNPPHTEFGLWKGVTYGIDAYSSVLTQTSKYSKIKSTFTRILADVEAGGCVLLHCYAGTDRTGTIAALLLGLLGVNEGDIIKDWEMTSFSCWFNRVRISDWETRDVVRKECPEGQLRQFFQKLKSTYGKSGETLQQQVEAFLTKKVGLTAAQISRLRAAMVCP